MKPEDIIEQVIDIATSAGKEIRGIYQQGDFEREIKSDNTPVTSADLAANDIICSKLAALTPDIPILSEESVDIPLSEREQWQRYWLVDPLDGTGEFIAGSGDFSVIIALVEHNRPIVGVVYAPMTEVCYYAIAGLGAYKRDTKGETRIQTNQVDQDKHDHLRIAVSRRQDPQSVLKLFNNAKHCQLVVLGGAALKSCLVAEGRADCYVRLGPTGEWDTGAAQIIVEEAGGAIMDLNLQPLSYNERDSLENPNFIVVGMPSLPWDELLVG
ncbi:3'(2'),5'-bisphosphate nucleotidase CysQ [Shewanella sp. WXL01]|uniref:3'(2'),5'-bisphosphate nucleotidase CysQ n=1 Tax=Shewanella maritima TaxID=2520507 RepID=A0A411PHG8_9GAMM|nr:MULTISPECIES: 3'(2'),5'-bisphosphate nucleotidase CysQ [Shewanella]NKF52492.1 3'(2'),5'-bisphosphate nucleotidase CysQ [Shewanella sp. WXL01]QBF82904.1 3'(2'),5'-bisphosphate nucleotidase [Shewanella maritima]